MIKKFKIERVVRYDQYVNRIFMDGKLMGEIPVRHCTARVRHALMSAYLQGRQGAFKDFLNMIPNHTYEWEEE